MSENHGIAPSPKRKHTRPPPPTNPDLLTSVAAAAYCGVAEVTFKLWRTTGAGPKYVKLGQRVFYRKSTLDRWIASREFAHTAEAGTRAPKGAR